LSMSRLVMTSDCTPTRLCLQAGMEIFLPLEVHVFERMTQVAITGRRMGC